MYAEHGALVHSFCRRSLDPARAADATQDVFLAAWRSRDRYRPDAGTLAGWLVGIARFKVIDILRADGRQPRLVADPQVGEAVFGRSGEEGGGKGGGPADAQPSRRRLHGRCALGAGAGPPPWHHRCARRQGRGTPRPRLSPPRRRCQALAEGRRDGPCHPRGQCRGRGRAARRLPHRVDGQLPRPFRQVLLRRRVREPYGRNARALFRPRGGQCASDVRGGAHRRAVHRARCRALPDSRPCHRRCRDPRRAGRDRKGAGGQWRLAGLAPDRPPSGSRPRRHPALRPARGNGEHSAALGARRGGCDGDDAAAARGRSQPLGLSVPVAARRRRAPRPVFGLGCVDAEPLPDHRDGAHAPSTAVGGRRSHLPSGTADRARCRRRRLHAERSAGGVAARNRIAWSGPGGRLHRAGPRHLRGARGRDRRDPGSADRGRRTDGARGGTGPSPGKRGAIRRRLACRTERERLPRNRHKPPEIAAKLGQVGQLFSLGQARGCLVQGDASCKPLAPSPHWCADPARRSYAPSRQVPWTPETTVAIRSCPG